jgi:hypothetical protein
VQSNCISRKRINFSCPIHSGAQKQICLNKSHVVVLKVQEVCKHKEGAERRQERKKKKKTALRKCPGSDIIFLFSAFAFASSSSSSSSSASSRLILHAHQKKQLHNPCSDSHSSSMNPSSVATLLKGLSIATEEDWRSGRDSSEDWRLRALPELHENGHPASERGRSSSPQQQEEDVKHRTRKFAQFLESSWEGNIGPSSLTKMLPSAPPSLSLSLSL